MIEALLHAITLALLFVLFATGAYKRSYTTTIYIVSLAISIECYTICDSDLAYAIVLLGAVVSLVRAIINRSRDRFIKRGGGRCGTLY